MAPNKEAEEIREISKSWDGYSYYVLETLREFRRTHETFNAQLDKIREDLPLLKFKTGILFAGISVVASAVVSGIVAYIMSHTLK